MKFLFHILIFITLKISISSHDIAIVTLAVGKKYQEAVNPGIVSKQLYCNHHGYDFIVCEDHLDTSRPIPWSKILLTQELLSKYKWIFFSDADSLIMNYSTPLESFIDENYNLIICRDMHSINTGQYFIKNSAWSFDLLKRIYEQSDVINHPLWEQQGLNQLLEKQPDLEAYIKVLPQRTFNSYWNEWYNYHDFKYVPNSTFEENDFIIHLSQCKDLKNLKKMMHEYATKSMFFDCNKGHNLNCFE